MSKYNKLPGAPEGIQEEQIVTPVPKMPISKLCCLPIFMADNKDYKKQLNQIMSLEELMPKTQRLQIYQMMYMDSLLEKVREYRPEIKDEEKDIVDIISKFDKSGSSSKMAATMTSMMEFQKTKDPSTIFQMLMPNNPMMSMLLPMLTMSSKEKNSGNSQGMGDMMQSILPMMMGQNPDMLSSLFKGMM